MSMQPFRRFAPDARPDVDVATGRASFIFNTEDVGRDGHVVRNAGIQLDNYRRNPVILWAHDDQTPPVGRAVDISISGPAARVSVEFTPADINPFGAMIGELVKARFLNAVSESWQPIKAKRLASGDGYDFTEVDLLEISIVPVPALPQAIATARTRGIDTSPMLKWSERHLDRGGVAGIERGQLLALRRAASGGFTAYSLPDDGGRAERVARGRLLRISKPPVREALERVQTYHASCELLHGELSATHDRMTEGVSALAVLSRRLKRAVSKGDDSAIADISSDINERAGDIEENHGSSGRMCAALGLAVAGAKGGLADAIDGLSGDEA